MTVMDKVNATTRTVVQSVVDKEPINYIEAGGLYAIVAHARYNVASLAMMYNHAQDPELKQLLKDAIDDHTENTIKQIENLLSAGGASVPQFGFPKRELSQHVDIPVNARLTDAEIVVAVSDMARASQMALLGCLHGCYQLEVGMVLRRMLDAGLDWNYRLLQLTLHRGWLPHIAKVEH